MCLEDTVYPEKFVIHVGFRKTKFHTEQRSGGAGNKVDNNSKE